MNEYDELFKEVDKVFKEVDKVFKQMDINLAEAFDQQQTKLNNASKWQPYYCKFPKKVGKKWFWRSTIYRKFVLSPGGGFWKYGTEFDVMQESK
jgi:hypothetical protein